MGNVARPCMMHDVGVRGIDLLAVSKRHHYEVATSLFGGKFFFLFQAIFDLLAFAHTAIALFIACFRRN